mmetsp:Transcript_21540/g.55041  ORF Transcript_21540/g.55041 Transcript_21540/m.55041 type:complete len:404 (-) Transcript_21540:174-1385(-)
MSADTIEVALDARALNYLRQCRTCIGQGSKGFLELRRAVEAAPDEPWALRIPVNDAVKSDHLPILKYLLDDAKVETLNVKTDGYTPLQLSVIWGKLDIMVYLLSRGADPMLSGESSVVDMARLRQQRLQEALERSGEGAEFEGFSITKSRIEPLIDEGLAILVVLEGVEKYGSYPAWAEHNGSHPLVKRFSSDIDSSEPRYQLAVFRALVLKGGASLHSEAERATMAAEEAAQVAARAKAEQPLLDALVEAGFSAGTAKELRDTFRVPTVKGLRACRLTPEDIEAKLEPTVRQRRILEGEKRRFARYVRELEEPSASQAADASSQAAAKATAKGAAKSKATAAPAAKAALLALSAKGAGRGSAAKAAPPKPRKAMALDSMAVLFRGALPDIAFMLITRFLFGV